MENVKNPLEDVTAGLLDSSGQQLPLQAVHVKCKLMDLLSQVEQKAPPLGLGLFYLMISFKAEREFCFLLGNHFPEIHQPELRPHRGQVRLPSG